LAHLSSNSLQPLQGDRNAEVGGTQNETQAHRRTDRRRRPVALVADVANAVPSVTRSCTGRAYRLIDPNAFPTIRQLRTFNLPRLTDGYAPRCLVAESIAGFVQTRRGRPRRFRVGGARWYAGIWVVRRTIVRTPNGGYARFRATHGRQRVTFNGYS
jgi:hypothetical protein